MSSLVFAPKGMFPVRLCLIHTFIIHIYKQYWTIQIVGTIQFEYYELFKQYDLNDMNCCYNLTKNVN